MLLLFAFAFFVIATAQNPPPTPLDEYVARDDPTFDYRLISQQDFADYTVYHLNLTSQTWLTTAETTTPVWWHFLTLVVPDVLDPLLDTGFLDISSGRNTDTSPPNPETSSSLIQGIRLARDTGTVFAYLRQIPNQPLFFVKDNSSRREDSAIAYTWRRFMDDPDDERDILMRLPMTKGAVAAMDAIMEWSLFNLPQPVARFFVTGSSKRGWTTYTTAISDPLPGRVFGIAPRVISILNMNQNFHHHRESLGGWSFALGDYWLEGLVGNLDHPNMQKLADIVDPYSYRGRLTMPMLLIGGCSDEFFLPDSYRHFYDDLSQPKALWVVENTGHSMSNSPRADDIWTGMKNFYLFAALDVPFPTLSWTHSETETEGSIVATLSESPLAIKAWVADSVSTTRRDFRLSVGYPPTATNIVWEERPVTMIDSTRYSVTVDKPTEGWRGFFIEVQFRGLLSSSNPNDILTFSTEVNIIPDTLPFPRCNGFEDCQGEIL